MDVKLDSLIEKIKQDGFNQAKKTSQDIINQAQNQAKDIVEAAKEEAKQLKIQAETEAKKLKINTEGALKQAARDLALSLKEEIAQLFSRVLKTKVAQDLTPDFLKSLIIKIVASWPEAKKVSLEVVVSDEDKEKLKSLLLKELNSQLKESIVIKTSKAIDRGFRIGIKGDDLYYDFTAESITEALKEFLNPAISRMLDTK